MVAKDLELLWATLDRVSNVSWLDGFFRRIVAKHPWRDVCALIWVFFVYGCYQYKSKHFWVVLPNLGGAFCE
jgi:hypothetical protein